MVFHLPPPTHAERKMRCCREQGGIFCDNIFRLASYCYVTLILLKDFKLKFIPVHLCITASALTFASDWYILAADQNGAWGITSHSKNYVSITWTIIATNKCVLFQTVPTKDPWYIWPQLTFSHGDKLPSTTAKNTLSYLGGQICLWLGKLTKDIVKQLSHSWVVTRN